MFGTILPYKPELKVREWQEYRAAYCGLCKQLQRRHGFFARLFLNYDLVLLALLADGLAGNAGSVRREACAANPLQKRPVCGETPGLALAADALVLSVYYKLRDDVADEGFARRLAARCGLALLRRSRRNAAARLPEADAVLAAQTQAQQALEAAGETDADAAADPTAQMTSALFGAAAAGPEQANALRRMGLFTGKVIYYLDAAEDYEKDARSGAYNVFLRQGLSRDQAVDECRRLCRLCAGEMSLCYNLLPLSAHKGLLDNIVFLGLPQSIAHAGTPMPKPRGD